ncbi:MAG: segregation/condensation protein A [Burkholderiales bacterium]|nr:segregation/condensation protein A [Burkholderiales bacterium]
MDIVSDAVASAETADPGATPLARLYGEPFTELPRDLYIPPDALEVFLDAFEGPLDLLLYLIRRQNFNILDIPMARVTEQYLTYVEEVRSRNLELAAEYLLMAALLIEIKSRMLLPVLRSDEAGEAEDPRAELVRRLLEYERIKRAALELDALPLAERDFWPAQVMIEVSAAAALPEVNADDLRVAWLEVIKRAKLTLHHRIGRAELSVREHMSMVLRRLKGERFVEFADLFGERIDVQVAVVTFLALLELVRESLVEVTQAEAYAPIYVRLAFTPT